MPSSVRGELDRLVQEGAPLAIAARAYSRRFPTREVEGRGDEAVLEAAVKHAAWVVTADRELAERLSRHGVTALVPRDRHRLEVLRARPAARRAPGGRTKRRRASRGNA